MVSIRVRVGLYAGAMNRKKTTLQFLIILDPTFYQEMHLIQIFKYKNSMLKKIVQ